MKPQSHPTTTSLILLVWLSGCAAHLIGQVRNNSGSTIPGCRQSAYDCLKQRRILAGPYGARPLTGKTIVLDAGHGGADPGAVRNGVQEKDLTLAITLKLKALLEDEGATVVLTRDRDAFVELSRRAEINKAVNPDVFISIHINASENAVADGIETYFFSDESEPLAKALQGSMTSWLQEKDRLVHRRGFYVVKCSVVPAVLLEVGYISHLRQRGLLSEEQYQLQLASTILNGIKEYFARSAKPNN